MRQHRYDFSPLTLSEFDTLTGQLSRLLSTKEAPVIIPGEAILGIEAIAAGVSAPGRTILNIVTGPYGSLFGEWLTRGGSEVVEVVTAFDEVVTIEKIAAAIKEYCPCAISFVQAEAITGGSNPTEKILELARQNNLITIIDSVSAIGAEPVLMDEWNIDFVAVGPQKALAGPNGISAVGISKRGWEFLEANDYAPRNSILSLLDYKDLSDRFTGRKVPANISVLEARALIEALNDIEQEGLINVNRRHSLSSKASIAGIKALGLKPWQNKEVGFSPLNTTVRILSENKIKIEQSEGIIAPGDGDLYQKLIRINHYGASANRRSVEEAIVILARIMNKEPDEALTEIRSIWSDEDGK